LVLTGTEGKVFKLGALCDFVGMRHDRKSGSFGQPRFGSIMTHN
jgi:hypothetical protein